MFEDMPVFGICGHSGSGKTILIERIVPLLRGRGLEVAVVKHDVHGVLADPVGKDSARLFQSGADVLLEGPGQTMLRSHGADTGQEWSPSSRWMAPYDIILVEGHKALPWPKVWLLSPGESRPPPGVNGVVATIGPDTDGFKVVVAILDSWLRRQCLSTPVFGCVMIGGKSRRMGWPKHLIRTDGQTWLQRTTQLLRSATEFVVVAGCGDIPDELAGIPRLPDVPDSQGPMAGVLAAMRWAPRVSWLVAACDLPFLSSESLQWLLSTRAPGVWATLPRLAGGQHVEPLLAHYDWRARWLIEHLCVAQNFRLGDLVRSPKVRALALGQALERSWANANTPADLERLCPSETGARVARKDDT